MADVFISYARADKSRAEQFYRAIKQAGWTVWWDADILPGERWRHAIREALADAGVVVLLWSRHSTNSEPVLDEVDVAIKQNKLVPVLLDGTIPEFGMSQRQYEDLSSWDGEDQHHAGLVRVRSAIRNILLEDGRTPPPPLQPAPVVSVAPVVIDEKPRGAGWRAYAKYALIAGVVVIVLTSGVTLFLRRDAALKPMEPSPAPAATADVTPITPPANPAPGSPSRSEPGGSRAAGAGSRPGGGGSQPRGGGNGSNGSTSGRPSAPSTDGDAPRPVKEEPASAPIVLPMTSASGCAAASVLTRTHPEVHANFFALGKCQYDAGHFNEAVAAFNTAVDINPNLPEYFRARGLAKWKNNLASQGITDLDTAIALAPRDGGLYESRGEIRLATRDFQRAMEDFDKATRLAPLSKSAWLGLANAAEKNGSPSIAGAARERADKLP
jgi:hypothetical protein